MSLLKKAGAMIATAIASVAFITSTAYAADYTVVQNDSLYKIGTLFNTTVNSIMTDNRLSSTTIYPGQILDVPAPIHTVKRGDTLYRISIRYGISLTALQKANNEWDGRIVPGQQLLIPQGRLIEKSIPATNTSKTVISYTQAEVDLLARLITAEAIGETYDAKVGVGAVVVNRVQSSEWPSSINTVINHVAGGYHQFTPVKNGMIHNQPTDDAVKAAWAALYGADPSKGALFYFDDSSTNTWLWSKAITARIDSMVFVK